MNYVEQEVVFEGVGDHRPGLGLPFAQDVFGHLNRTVRPCVRMALTGRSQKVGHPHEWLSRATDVRFNSFQHKGDRTTLVLAMPTLGVAAPKFFEQQSLFDSGIREDQTALDLLTKMIRDIRNEIGTSDTYDEGMLTQVANWKTFFDKRANAVLFPSSAANVTAMDATVVKSAEHLARITPAARQIRVVGTVDMIRWSTRSLGLRLTDGTEVRCAVVNEELSDLKSFGDRQVTILGKAVYRPSGTVLRLDVEQILDTTVGAEQFSMVPPSVEAKWKPEVRMAAGRKVGVAAFLGTWPGEESEEELLASLAEMEH